MRLIDADALKSYIDGEISMSREEREDADAKDDALGMAHNNGEIQEARRIKRYIEKHAQTIDAEPVVRCKDCKHRQDPQECYMCFTEVVDVEGGRMYKFTDLTQPDGYCHKGAKMDGDEDADQSR